MKPTMRTVTSLEFFQMHFKLMENPEFINCETGRLPDTYRLDNVLGSMINSDHTSSEPDIKEPISGLIKEESLTEEIIIKSDPDEEGLVKLEQDITSLVVPKVERELQPSASFDDFERDISNGAKNEIDGITGSLKNELHPSVFTYNIDGVSKSAALERSIITSDEEHMAPDADFEESKSVMKERNCRCHICGQICQTEDLKIHLLEHSGEQSSFPRCTIGTSAKANKTFSTFDSCSKLFSTSGELLRRDHVRYLPFTCSYCGKAFGYQSSLDSHVQSHTGEKPDRRIPLACSYCGKVFGYQSALDRHLRSHTGEKPHRCTTCGKAFTRKSNLHLHMSQTSEKYHYCSFCCKKFTLKADLEIHKTTHSGEGEHSICGKDMQT